MARGPRPVLRVEGVRQLDRSLRELGDKDGRKALREAGKPIAVRMAMIARSLAPVGNGKTVKGRRVGGGALKRSIKPYYTTTSTGAKAGTPARVPYAAAIHWGSSSWPKDRGAAATARNARMRSQKKRQSGGPGQLQRHPFLWVAAKVVTNDRSWQKEYLGRLQDLIDQHGLG